MLFPMPSFSSPKQGGRQKTGEAWGWREGDKERKEEKEKKWRAERRRGGGKEEEGTTGKGMERKRCHACHTAFKSRTGGPRTPSYRQTSPSTASEGRNARSKPLAEVKGLWNGHHILFHPKLECMCKIMSLSLFDLIFFLLFHIFWLPNSYFFQKFEVI